MAASRSHRLSVLALVLSSFALVACEGAVDPLPKDSEPPPACGDGKRDDAEECDDGNLIDGDGCSSECMIERRAPECEGAADGSPCYQGERICSAGFCIIPECADPSDCAPRACFEAAECAIGLCLYGARLADNTECGDGRICRGGECISTACTSDTECPPKSSCHAASTCNFSSLECVDGPPLPNGAACESGGVCIDGECATAECRSDADCAHENSCRAPGRCDLTSFKCEAITPLADKTSCNTPGGGAGYCFLGECSGRCVSDAECDNGEECDGAEYCSPSLRCESDPATWPSEGSACGPAGEGGVCTRAGVCLPEACTADAECHPSDACRGYGACVNNGCVAPAHPLPDGTRCGEDGDGVCVGGSCDLHAECLVPADCESEGICAAFECAPDYRCALAADQSATDGSVCELGGTEGRCSDGACILPECGNGIMEADEQCDDGNTEAGDGCSARCRVEILVGLRNFALVDPNVFLPDSLDAAMASECQNFTQASVLVDEGNIPAFNSQLSLLNTLSLILEPAAGGDEEGEEGEEEPSLVIRGGGLPSKLSGTYDGVCIASPADGLLTPDWGGAPNALNLPEQECLTARFEGAPPLARLNLAGAEVNLHELAIGAQWDLTSTVDGPALNGLERGTLRGFLRAEEADSALFRVGEASVPLSSIFSGGAASCRPANAGDPHYELDNHDGHDGWWLFFNFDGALEPGPG